MDDEEKKYDVKVKVIIAVMITFVITLCGTIFLYGEYLKHKGAIINTYQSSNDIVDQLDLLRTVIEYQKLILKKDTSVNMDGKRMDKQISKARRNTGFSFSPA